MKFIEGFSLAHLQYRGMYACLSVSWAIFNFVLHSALSWVQSCFDNDIEFLVFPNGRGIACAERTTDDKPANKVVGSSRFCFAAHVVLSKS